MDGRSLKSHFCKRGPRKTWMIHPIKTNGSSRPRPRRPPTPPPPHTPPAGSDDEHREHQAETHRAYASVVTGARTPPLGCCSSTISWIQRATIPHMRATLLVHSKPFPDQLCAVRTPLTFHPAAPLHCQVAVRMDEISSADVNTDISSSERERKINKEQK